MKGETGQTSFLQEGLEPGSSPVPDRRLPRETLMATILIREASQALPGTRFPGGLLSPVWFSGAAPELGLPDVPQRSSSSSPPRDRSAARSLPFARGKRRRRTRGASAGRRRAVGEPSPGRRLASPRSPEARPLLAALGLATPRSPLPPAPRPRPPLRAGRGRCQRRPP